MLKRKWPMFALLLAPLLLALVMVPLSRRQREFIHLFERVPNTQACHAMDGSMWMGSEEVACVVPVPLPAPGAVLSVGAPTLEAVDVKMGAHRKLAKTPPHQDIGGNWGVIVSPDGKWILWPGMKYDAQSDLYSASLWNALRLDGSRFVQRARVADSISSRGLAWLPDSSGWVEATVINRARNGRTNGVTLRVCSLDSSAVRKFDVKEARNANKTFAVTGAGEAIIGCDRAGLTLVSVPLMKPGLVREHPVRLPARFGDGQLIARALISPRGDRIAWTFHDSAAQTAEIWLSDINGTKFEPLTPALNERFEAPRNLHWTPDGKALAGWRPNPKDNPNALSLYRINIPNSLSLKP